MLSSITLANLEARILRTLMDTGAAIWSLAQVDEGIRLALGEYSRRRPLSTIGTVTLTADSREVALSSLTNLIGVERVWFPYDSTSPNDFPTWIEFDIFDNAGTLTLHLLCDDDPATDDVARIWYDKIHTVNGLDSATSTTFNREDEDLMVLGAAGYVCLQRSVDLNETAANMAVSTPNYGELAERFLKEFRDGLYRVTAVSVIASPDWSWV